MVRSSLAVLKQAEYQFENGDKLKPQFLAETE